MPGLVGGNIVLHLLARGEAPECIRIIDFRQPFREDMVKGAASKVAFFQADISSESSTKAAFEELWPRKISALPLTVFHTAAVINPHDRSKAIFHRVSAVNIDGTANVLSSAKAAGASVFIATSSGSVAVRPTNFWVPLWRHWPDRYLQMFTEDDAYKPLRPHEEFFGNYAAAKAQAERLVLEANSEKFKTGCIRPVNGIYGNKYDQTSGNYLGRGVVPTYVNFSVHSTLMFSDTNSWIPHIVQNFVSGDNISLSHLLFEAALLSETGTVGGKTFNITDPNPPITFADLYNCLSILSVTPFKANTIPGFPLLILSYPIEQYHILQSKFPKILPELNADLKIVQPSLFFVSAAHLIGIDDAARKPVKEGGLGYKGANTTLEGMCMQMKVWNDEHAGDKKNVGSLGIATEIKNVGAVPSAVGT
jgi:nucleoside-diphosphate-sugar epimerase